MADERRSAGPRKAPGKVKDGKNARANARTMAWSLVAVAILLVGGGLAYFLLSGDEDRGAFVFYTAHDVQTLDPADAFDEGSRLPIENMYDTLVRQSGSEPERFLPCLATGWTVSDDGLWYNFTLREGVRFSNGNAFGAADVLFTLDRVVKMASPGTGTSKLISERVDFEECAAVGETGVAIKLVSPAAAFMSSISQSFPMGIVDREYTLAHYTAEDEYAHDFMREHPIGTGPYKLAGWTHGKELGLELNAGYWGGWEGLHERKVVLRYEPDGLARIDAVRDGRADAAEVPPSLATDAAAVLDADLVSFPDARVEVLAMNFKPLMGGQSFMTDPLVRKAFSYAVNYENISSGSYGSAMTPINGCIPDVMPFASESQPSKAYDFNLTKASELLNESGHRLDDLGHRFNGSRVKLAYEPGDASRQAGATQLASDLGRIGVLVEVFENEHEGPTVGRSWDVYLASLRSWYLDPEYFVTALAVSSGAGGDVFRTGINDVVLDAAAARASSSSEGISRVSNYSVVWRELGDVPNMAHVGQVNEMILVADHIDVVYYHPVTSLDMYSIREA
jgi:peptide/nickel transport system substrate-binding protein